MKEWNRVSRSLLSLIAIWMIVSLVYMSVGSSGVTFFDFISLVFGNLEEEQAYLVRSVLFDIRVPRFFKCILSGAAMAVSGVLTQGLFRNSLAAPSVLGLSAGAGLFACLTYYLGWYLLGFWVLPLASFLGAVVLIALLLGLMRSFTIVSREALLLAGFAFNILCGAFITLIISFSLESSKQTPAIMHWLMGDYSYPLATYIWFCAVVISLALFWAYRLCAGIEVFSLGDEVAKSLAIEPERLKVQSLLVVALLVGVSVSMVGTVPFVGLIVPHILRYVFGPHVKNLLLVSAFGGGIFVLLADLLARSLMSPGELQTGILLALIGAPFFIYILVWQRRGVFEE